MGLLLELFSLGCYAYFAGGDLDGASSSRNLRMGRGSRSKVKKSVRKCWGVSVRWDFNWRDLCVRLRKIKAARERERVS